MLRTFILAFALASASAAPAVAACAGVDLAISPVTVKNVTQANGMNHYTLSGTVSNVGGQAQASNALQFVDIYQKPTEKLDSKSIPPLRPGESHSFSYVMLRSSEAGNGTTTLHFQLDFRQPMLPAADCDTSNDHTSVTF
ncbi:MAG: hypothetical protein WB615_15780 [Candidatus Tumulicola sp.]